MPIQRLLADSKLTLEQRQVLVLAFNNTLSHLNLIDRNDPICEMIARKVIEVGARGISNAVAISEIACKGACSQVRRLQRYGKCALNAFKCFISQPPLASCAQK
jgi:hypothetical protein